MAEQVVTVIERHPDLVVVHLKPESIDASNLTAVHTEVAAAGMEVPGATVAVDMARVSVMPSMAVSGFTQLAPLFGSRKQGVVLISARPAVRDALVVTLLDRLFVIHPDLSELLAHPTS